MKTMDTAAPKAEATTGQEKDAAATAALKGEAMEAQEEASDRTAGEARDRKEGIRMRADTPMKGGDRSENAGVPEAHPGDIHHPHVQQEASATTGGRESLQKTASTG